MKILNGMIKWIVTLLLALSAGLLVIIFLSSKPELGAYLLRLILLTSVGFIGGITTRALFRGIPSVITILFNMFSNLLAVLAIDHFYATSFQFQFLSNDFRFQSPTVSDGSQFILMTLISLLPLLAFRKISKSNVNNHRAPKHKKVHKSFTQIIQPVLDKAYPGNWNLLKKSKSIATKPLPIKKSMVEKPVLSVARPNSSIINSQPVTIHKRKANMRSLKTLKLPGKFFKGSQTDVKLVGEEEHVCPYCLEEVTKGDSRGVTVCTECGTWHHQDCWSLTGSCGVAHRNEL
jgi:ribosomal protein L37AE/L43A